jgi:molecular chaperone DnaK
MNVSAKDKGTGKEQKIRIEASSGLTDEEIEKMKNEAKANADSDKEAKEKIDKINAADSLIFQTDKQLKEYGDKLSEANKTAIEGALTKLREAHGKQDIAAIDASMEELNTVWQAASQEIYAAQQATDGAGGDTAEGATGGGDADGSGSDSDVSDVEFEEVSDDKK